MKYFLIGSSTGVLLVLNSVYESERAKQKIRDETRTLIQISDFNLDQISQFRSKDLKQRKLPAKNHCVDSLETHYDYFMQSTMQAYFYQMFNWSPTLTIRATQRRIMA